MKIRELDDINQNLSFSCSCALLVKLQGKTRAEEEQQSPDSWQSGRGRDSWANPGGDKDKSNHPASHSLPVILDGALRNFIPDIQKEYGY